MEKPIAYLETKGNLKTTIKDFLTRILEEDLVDSLLVASGREWSPLPMPTLFSDSREMELIDPLAPVSPFNTARQASRLLRSNTNQRLALVLRPCEIRALIELAKLNQCQMDKILLIGIECKGRMENRQFLEQLDTVENLTDEFYRDTNLQEKICFSCATCLHFQPTSADISFFITDNTNEVRIGVFANSNHGEEFLNTLGIQLLEDGESHQKQMKERVETRLKEREKRNAEIKEKINPMSAFQSLIANCLNCYNCRMACPVCYCKECVFITDVFLHEPELLLSRAQKKGQLKMPTDTTMFHLTRLTHMSHSCVGCGQCSSVCPSDIPVADIFRAVADEVQDLYSYTAGLDVDQPPPYLAYKEKTEVKD